MKKVILFIAFAVIVFSAYAQIKVNTNGDVGIKKTNPAYGLDVYGTMRVCVPGASYGGLVFDHSGWGNATTLSPKDNWYGCLGNSDKQFNLLYVDHVICRSCYCQGCYRNIG
jgi:hypothetical protein